ncbi:MAG: phosphoribosylaminoimidazolesuccinocarboxamide synthase [Candidatus Tectomicrobia bacterium]|nr:phosphoribosylaminoimidazolesuccinocarboxamide synthase [Candidatus Tectomicrobia bacterium]
MEKREKIYEGKAKILYATDDPDRLIQYFKDDATAFNAAKRGTIAHKGVMNNTISTLLFLYLESRGVKTHFVEKLGDREMLVRRLQMVPLEMVARNIVAGSLAKRMGLEEGGNLSRPVVEWYYKRDELGDPFLNEDHVLAFELCDEKTFRAMRETTLRINELLREFFLAQDILLVDFKVEFGRSRDGELLLGDEITPDGCRLWDRKTREKLDKDRFRRDLGGVEEAYREVLSRVEHAASGGKRG